MMGSSWHLKDILTRLIFIMEFEGLGGQIAGRVGQPAETGGQIAGVGGQIAGTGARLQGPPVGPFLVSLRGPEGPLEPMLSSSSDVCSAS